MGSLVVPPAGLVYFDANSVIYSVEKHPTYGPLLWPVWRAAQAKTIEIVSSDLVLLETLVDHLKHDRTVPIYRLGEEPRLASLGQDIVGERDLPGL